MATTTSALRSDFGFHQMDGKDFGAFKSERTVETAATTKASTASVFTEAEASVFTEASGFTETSGGSKESKRSKGSKGSKEKSKKKKKKKSKSSSSSKRSSKSSRSSVASSASASFSEEEKGKAQRAEMEAFAPGSYSHNVFSKMLQDAMDESFSDDFGDFGDLASLGGASFATKGTSFESICWEGADGIKKSSGSTTDGSRSGSESASRRSGSTQETPLRRGTASMGGNTATTSASTKSKSSKGSVELVLPTEDFFDQQNSNQQALNAAENDDDDSILSEITGLTGAFLHKLDHSEVEEDEEKIEVPNALRRQFPGKKFDFENDVGDAPTSSGFAKTETSSLKKHKRNKPPQELRFSSVSVRYYERILTENPSTTHGPSIGLGWRYKVAPERPVDVYEEAFPDRKISNDLIMHREEREQLVKSLGYSKAVIAAAVRSNMKVRHQRRQTIQNLGACKVEEALEGAGQRVKRILSPFARNK